MCEAQIVTWYIVSTYACVVVGCIWFSGTSSSLIFSPLHSDIGYCFWQSVFMFGTVKIGWSSSNSKLVMIIIEKSDMLRITTSDVGCLGSIIFFLRLWLGYAFASVKLSARWMLIAMSCMYHFLNWTLLICICGRRFHFYQFSLQWRDLHDIVWVRLPLALWFYLLWNQSALFSSQSGASWKFLILPQKAGLGR